MKSLLGGAATAAKASPLAALWTFPSILFSAMMISWGAEAAQFLVSQGLALAILAWLQTLPEFMVEAVIAWEAGKDPSRVHLAIANFTGSIRLLVGLGWPMIYFVAAYFSKRTGKRKPFAPIELDDDDAVEVMGLLPPVLWFGFIWWKGSLGLWDAGVLTLCYVVYLAALWKLPPETGEIENINELPGPSRWALQLGGRRRALAIVGMFVIGGAILLASAHQFVESMLALAATMGISQFVFVQWFAPFLSEFPEKLSAFNWARQITKAPMAMMNMVSSTINQWSILSAMIPIIYSFSKGAPAAIVFDEHQRLEILLTILQSVLAWLLLINMNLTALEAGVLFVLWFVQFVMPGTRHAMVWVYAGWCALILGEVVIGRRQVLAPQAALRAFRHSAREEKP